MKTKIVYASQYAALDSDVYAGGGTDDTEALQAVLDMAKEQPLCLIMDGAALVSGLVFHSNTTIQCVDPTCGFYLKDGSNRALLRNSMPHYSEILNENVSILGGTYNFNCLHQEHDIPISEYTDPVGLGDGEGRRYIVGFSIFGIRNLLIRDVTTVDQRTFDMMVCNFEHVTMENLHIRLPNNMYGQNQDGLHFWGPGKCLVLRNIKGCAGDDFIALAPDEHDEKSDITDVLIDGVMLEDADQGIRLLSRKHGRLDRVVIRHVTGVYKSFGFYINPWFADCETKGNIGNIVIENIDLVQKGHKYDYSVPLLFRLGGEIERMTIRNVRHANPTDVHTFLQLGGPYGHEINTDPRQKTHIGTLLLQDVEFAGSADSPGCKGVEVKCPVDNLIVSDVLLSDRMLQPFICFFEGGRVKRLIADRIVTNGAELLPGEEKACADFVSVDGIYP